VEFGKVNKFVWLKLMLFKCEVAPND